MTLYRTEVLHIHAAYELVLSSLKDPKKLSKQKVCLGVHLYGVSAWNGSEERLLCVQNTVFCVPCIK